jgi:hypothetical protein
LLSKFNFDQLEKNGLEQNNCLSFVMHDILKYFYSRQYHLIIPKHGFFEDRFTDESCQKFYLGMKFEVYFFNHLNKLAKALLSFVDNNDSIEIKISDIKI